MNGRQASSSSGGSGAACRARRGASVRRRLGPARSPAGEPPRGCAEVPRGRIGRGPAHVASNATSVLVARITDHHTRCDPLGSSWGEWVPRTDTRAWNPSLAALAQAADERTAQLGRDTAAQPPAWVVEALGPVAA